MAAAFSSKRVNDEAFSRLTRVATVKRPERREPGDLEAHSFILIRRIRI